MNVFKEPSAERRVCACCNTDEVVTSIKGRAYDKGCLCQGTQTLIKGGGADFRTVGADENGVPTLCQSMEEGCCHTFSKVISLLPAIAVLVSKPLLHLPGRATVEKYRKQGLFFSCQEVLCF